MATLAKNLLRHPLFWGVLFAHALVYFLYGSAIDTDGAAAKDINFSAYIAFTKIITVLSIASLMPFVYGAFLAASVTIHFRARNWPAAIFFANPFVIYNACDVFNRFVLSLALASLAAWGIRRSRPWEALGAFASFATLHPINLVFLAFASAPLMAPAVPLSISAISAFTSSSIVDDLFPDKVELYRSLGENIALAASGNFQLDPSLYQNGQDLLALAAVSIPGFRTVTDSVWIDLVFVYMIFWYFFIFYFMKYRTTVLLLSGATLGALSLVIGNSAVAARHFLPTLYLAILLFSGPASPYQNWLGLVDLLRQSFGARASQHRGVKQARASRDTTS